MRLIRATGQTITAANDGRVFAEAVADGLFDGVAFTISGSDISIPAFSGVACGRDYEVDATAISPKLSTSATPISGKIFLRIDMSQPSGSEVSIETEREPYTLTQEDINTSGGVIYEYLLATYTASNTAPTAVTMRAQEIDTGWIYAGKYLSYRKVGKMVTVRVRDVNGDYYQHLDIFGTLPPEAVPSLTMAAANTFDTGGWITVIPTTNQQKAGQVEFGTNGSATHYISAMVTYPV